MALLKAFVPGSLLTFIVSTIFGANGSFGQFLRVGDAAIGGFDFYWSWPLFIAATGIGWGLYALMD